MKKLICPQCGKAAYPKKKRTFDCPSCGYHANFSIRDGGTHYYKAGRRSRGLRLQSWRVTPEQAKLRADELRFALNKYMESEFYNPPDGSS